MPGYSFQLRRAPASFAWALATLMFAGTGFAQGVPVRAEIKDSARMFDELAVSVYKQELQRIAERLQLPIVIETIEELRGQTVEDAARRHAEQTGVQGIYILAAKRDHKIEVLVSKVYAHVVPEALRRKIQDAFIAKFRTGDFDGGLKAGLAALSEMRGEARPAPNPSDWSGLKTAGGSAEAPSSLVLRNQVRLTLAGARRVLAGAQSKAVELGLKVNIAVVDDGGHMFAFERMDGARPASIYTATTKAVTAATFRAPSGPVPAGSTAPDPLLNLSLQNAALAGGGKLTTLGGGIPVIVEGQIIGAIGVGGGSSEQDIAVARAGVEAFEAALRAPAEAPKQAEREPAPAEK